MRFLVDKKNSSDATPSDNSCPLSSEELKAESHLESSDVSSVTETAFAAAEACYPQWCRHLDRQSALALYYPALRD